MISVCQTALGGGNCSAVGATGGGNHSTGKNQFQIKTTIPLVIGELSTNERRRTTTAMQNFLTFKLTRTAASEVESARRGSSFHGLTRGRRQPLVSDSKFGRRQQPSSQGELLTNDRRRTATTMPTPTLTTTVTLRTKTTSLEVEIARRGSSFHGSIR